MQINELDVVELKDGRHGTVLEIYNNGEAFLVEISDQSGRALDMPTIVAADVVRVIWKNK